MGNPPNILMVVRTIGTKVLTVGAQQISVAATLEQDDVNNQLFVRVVAVSGTDSIEYRQSIGSSDGNDALAGMTAQDIAAQVQTALDALRQKLASALAAKLTVKQAAGLLK